MACCDAYESPIGVKCYGSESRFYYVKTMNALFKSLVINDNVDLFVVCNNDMEFMIHGWDNIIIDALYSQFDDGMGVLEIGNHADLSYNTFISRVGFWTKNYNGELFNPDYVQYYADADRLEELKMNDEFARMYPGLVNTHSMFDEVWHEGRQHMLKDKETYDAKHGDV